MNRGFTLIELMMVVAILGIIAAFAYPAYTANVLRGKLAEAPSQLAAYRVQVEQWYQDNRTYGAAGAAAGGSCGAAAPTAPAAKYFTYSCTTVGDNDHYLITAKSVAGSGLIGTANGDYTYTVDQNNNKATTKFAGSTNTSQCWIMKAGDSC